MPKPQSIVTALFVEQSSANHETRFAEQAGLYRHTGAGNDHQEHSVRSHIRLRVASNGQGQHSGEQRYV